MEQLDLVAWEPQEPQGQKAQTAGRHHLTLCLGWAHPEASPKGQPLHIKRLLISFHDWYIHKDIFDLMFGDNASLLVTSTTRRGVGK